MDAMHSSLPHTPSASDDETTDVKAILYEQLRSQPQEDPQPLVQARLQDEAGRLTMGQFGDSLVYGNSGGHGLLEDYGNMNRKMDILMARDESRKSQVEQVAKRVSSLEITVRRLTRSSEGYLSIRRRFFDVYKRDIMAVEELKGSKAIQEGNMLAHEGDALGDAVLFDNDQRTDKRVYRELYGLDHEQVLSFDCASDNGGLFLVLNAHATMVAQGKIIPQDLKVAFDCFLAKVEENWLKPPDKDPNTPLGCAYYNFWKIFNQQPKV